MFDTDQKECMDGRMPRANPRRAKHSEVILDKTAETYLDDSGAFRTYGDVRAFISRTLAQIESGRIPVPTCLAYCEGAGRMIQLAALSLRANLSHGSDTLLIPDPVNGGDRHV